MDGIACSPSTFLEPCALGRPAIACRGSYTRGMPKNGRTVERELEKRDKSVARVMADADFRKTPKGQTLRTRQRARTVRAARTRKVIEAIADRQTKRT